jgi:hypothetical protein
MHIKITQHILVVRLLCFPCHIPVRNECLHYLWTRRGDFLLLKRKEVGKRISIGQPRVLVAKLIEKAVTKSFKGLKTTLRVID